MSKTRAIDLTHLNWSTTRSNGVSYGCYYKATETFNGIKYYYKCSNLYTGTDTFGDESVYEVICSRLANILGLRAAKYSLIYAKVSIRGKFYNTYICKSKNFAAGVDMRITLEDFKDFYPGISVFDLVKHFNLSSQLSEMLIFDFLVMQRDRHGKNIEILRKNGAYTFSPLFDNGLTFLAPYPSSDATSKARVLDFDPLQDPPVNNYIGVRSLLQNLSLLQKPVVVNKLSKASKARLFYGLHLVLPEAYLDKIWEIIVFRYSFLRKRGILVDT